MIPLFKVSMSKKVDAAVLEVLHSGFIGEGQKNKEFDELLKMYTGIKELVTVNSGTTAIMMALRLCGVKAGDYVISTPMTCLATNLPIIDLGAHIYWADIDPDDGNISVESVERILETCPIQPKAIMSVDWGGYPCDYDELNALAAKYGCKTISDSAQSFGALYKNKFVGNQTSDFTCFSLQAIKQCTSVDGGILTFRDFETKEKARLMKWYGLDRETSVSFRCAQDVKIIGGKYHMNDVNSVIGMKNLETLSYNIDVAHMNAKKYKEAFSNLKHIKLKKEVSHKYSTNYLFNLFVKDVQDFLKFMKSKEIQCCRVHERNDIATVFEDYRVQLKGVDEFVRKEVAIPVGWWLSINDVEFIIDSVIEYDNGYNDSRSIS